MDHFNDFVLIISKTTVLQLDYYVIVYLEVWRQHATLELQVIFDLDFCSRCRYRLLLMDSLEKAFHD